MAGKKPAPAANEDFDEELENDGWDDDDSTEIDPKTGLKVGSRTRDWRDVEKFREMRELRRLVDDDFGMDEIFVAEGKPAAAAPTVKAKKKRRS